MGFSIYAERLMPDGKWDMADDVWENGSRWANDREFLYAMDKGFPCITKGTGLGARHRPADFTAAHQWVTEHYGDDDHLHDLLTMLEANPDVWLYPLS